MLTETDCAFKEWAVSCNALRDGRQTLLVRKGGIREDGGVFTLREPEFLLLPTYEHQNPALLRPEVVPLLAAVAAAPEAEYVSIDTFAVVDTVLVARDEEQVRAVLEETVWNAEYVRMRFEFNPYDPVYLVILRTYRLPGATRLPMLPEYVGCRSWTTLDRSISTRGAVPSIPEAQFARRRDSIITRLSE